LLEIWVFHLDVPNWGILPVILEHFRWMRRNLEITIKLPYQIKLTPQTPKTTENSLFLRFFFLGENFCGGDPMGKLAISWRTHFSTKIRSLRLKARRENLGPAESRLKAGSQPALGRLKAGVGLAEGAPT
jgi:hypothetical protein